LGPASVQPDRRVQRPWSGIAIARHCRSLRGARPPVRFDRSTTCSCPSSSGNPKSVCVPSQAVRSRGWAHRPTGERTRSICINRRETNCTEKHLCPQGPRLIRQTTRPRPREVARHRKGKPWPLEVACIDLGGGTRHLSSRGNGAYRSARSPRSRGLAAFGRRQKGDRGRGSTVVMTRSAAGCRDASTGTDHGRA